MLFFSNISLFVLTSTNSRVDSTKVDYDVLIVIFVVNKSNNTYKINN